MALKIYSWLQNYPNYGQQTNHKKAAFKKAAQ
jgi:hypothetical protein